MNFTIPLALFVLLAQSPVARVSAIVSESSCTRVDELRELYLTLERPPAQSALKPAQHREVAIFLAYCAHSPGASKPGAPGPIIKMSFAAHSAAFQKQLDLSRAINTVLALPGYLKARFTVSAELEAALRSAGAALLDLQLWRTEGMFGPDWHARDAAIVAKPAAQRSAEETEFITALTSWRDATFLP